MINSNPTFKAIRLAFFLTAAFSFLSISAQDATNETESESVQQKPTMQNYLQMPADPAVYPLTLVDGDKLKSLVIMDREVLTTTTTLKNISDKNVRVSRVLSGCPCLTIEKYKDVLLEPQKSIEIKLSLDAKRLQGDEDGFFEKKFVVTIDNGPTSYVDLQGKIKTMLQFEPSSVIDLGAFYGDVPTWKRNITMTSLFDDKELKIKMPSASRYFNFKLTLVSPKTVNIEITPKHHFPIGLIQEQIPIFFEDIPNYGPAYIIILGHAQALQFKLNNDSLSVKRSSIKPEAPFEFDTKITIAPPKNVISRLHQKLSAQKAVITHQPVSKEENESRPLDSLDTWKAFCPHFSIRNQPKGLKVVFSPENDGIKMHLTLTSELLKEEARNTNLNIFFTDLPAGIFRLQLN